MLPIQLEWRRCIDGVEVKAHHLKDMREGAVYRAVEARSDRFQSVTYTVTDLANPMVINFVNRRTEDERLFFLAEFGMLSRPDRETEEVALLEEARLKLLDMLTTPPRPDRIAKLNDLLDRISLSPVFDFSGPDQSFRLLLKPFDLRDLMGMEATMAHTVGATAQACQHCGKWFLTGPQTGRRSHAKFDTDRCRVAAMRARRHADKE